MHRAASHVGGVLPAHRRQPGAQDPRAVVLRAPSCVEQLIALFPAQRADRPAAPAGLPGRRGARRAHEALPRRARTRSTVRSSTTCPLSETAPDPGLRRRSQLHRVAGRRRGRQHHRGPGRAGLRRGQAAHGAALPAAAPRPPAQLPADRDRPARLGAARSRTRPCCAASRRSCTSSRRSRRTARAATPSCSRPTSASRARPASTVGDYIARHVADARAQRAARAPRGAGPARDAPDRAARAAVRRAHRHCELPARRLEHRAPRLGARPVRSQPAQVTAPLDAAGPATRRAPRWPAGGGLYLGAYGWVEELRPEDKDAHPGRRCRPTSPPIVDKHATVPLMRGPHQPRPRPRAVDQPRRDRGGAAQRLRRARRRDVGRPLVAAGPARAGDPRRDARRPVARRAARLPVRAPPPRQRAADGPRARLPAAPRVPAGRQPDPGDRHDGRRPRRSRSRR